MKLFMCFILTTLTLLSVGDDAPSESNHTHPELYCMRLLEKIEWIMDKMNDEITNFKDPTSYRQHMDALEIRLQNCYTKLGTHNPWR